MVVVSFWYFQWFCDGFAMLLGWFCQCVSYGFVVVVVVVLRWLCYGLLSCLGFGMVLLKSWHGFAVPHTADLVWFW